MKSIHSQPPWEVSKHGTPEAFPQYGIHNGKYDFCIVTGDNAIADANLIAAAPDLLFALEDLLLHVGSHKSSDFKRRVPSTWTEALKKAHAAVYKVREEV